MRIPRAGPVDISEPQPVHQRIAWWIENAFVRIAKRLFNSLSDSVQDMLSFAITEFTENIEVGLLDVIRPLLDEIQGYDDLPPWMRQTISNARSGDNAAAVILLAPLVMALTQVLSAGIQDAVTPIVAHRLNSVFRSHLVDSFTAIELYRKKLIDDGELLQLTRANGWPDWQTNYIKQLSEALYDQSELLTGYWRGLVSDATVDTQLSKRGYTAEHIDLWKQLSERIPSPGDLISIAVREGFDDAVASQFGYDEAFPGDAAEAAEKGGLSREWFARLWRAHWVLPSVTQGFDMFHRGILSRSELELLLRAKDIPAFWRNKLIPLSYDVITRVDVRRMYALGVFTEQEVYERYLSYGYSPEDCVHLTEWTIKQYAEKERALTKADILRMYRDSILDEREATAFLDALGYPGPEIGMLLAREDLQKTEAYEKEVIENIKVGFIQHIFDDTDVYQELGKLDPPAGFIDDQLALWRIERARRVIRPTVAQLRDMWQMEIIDTEELTEELQGRGYTPKYIKWYRKMWGEDTEE